MPGTRRGMVRKAVDVDLEAIAKRDPALAEGALAAAARALAAELDVANSATSKSMCARELRETMDRLRELLPAERERDAIDELRDRRASRRAAAAKSPAKPTRRRAAAKPAGKRSA